MSSFSNNLYDTSDILRTHVVTAASNEYSMKIVGSKSTQLSIQTHSINSSVRFTMSSNGESLPFFNRVCL
jgi:hypothetical protein